MIQSKYLGWIATVLAVLLVIGSIFMVMAVEKGEVEAAQPEYVTDLFGSGIIDIEIEADEDTWQSMLDNAQAEEYIMVNVTVNGVEYKDVGIRPKGNSSLSQVASSDSDRYSFRLKFNEYIKGQTCFGLESFVVNNVMGDSSYMKEYISYDIMKYIGVDTTLFEYADISLNGENWGFYLAVESYDEEFMQRNYGDSSGQLYSVKMSGMGGGMGADNNSQMPEMPDFENMPQNEDLPQEDGFGGMGGGLGGMGAGSGGSLEYTDDSISSYASIFENAVTKADESDNKRVIEALKALSEGRDLEKYFDVDQILRYFAAHTVVVNLDSYSSTMAQNYYIYEKNGKLSILPWDYGLAFGGFQSGDASSVVNFPIDTPVSGVSMEDRPLLNKLLENEEYMEKYHEYLQQIVTGYFDSGKFENTVDSLNTEIASYVENDPSKFITYDEYKTGVAELKKLITLRAESISGQLDGTIPSTTSEQQADSSALIDSSSIDMNALGSMMGGDMGAEGFGGGGNGEREFGQGKEMPDFEQNQTNQTSSTVLIWGVNPFILFMLIVVFGGAFVFIMRWKKEF